MSYADREDEWGGPRSAAEEAMSDLHAELETMTELAQAEENKAIEMADRIKSLEGVIEGYQEHVQELEAARAIERDALAAANHRVEALEADSRFCKELLEENVRLTDWARALKHGEVLANGMIEDLRAKLSARDETIEQLQGVDCDLHEASGKIDALNEECGQLALAISEQRVAYDGLKADCDHLRLKLHDAKETQAKADTLIGLLTKERGQDIARILDLEKALRNAQSEASCWRESFELAHGQIKTAREDVSNATHELIDAHAALSALGVPGDETETLIVRLGRLHAPLPK